MDFTYPADVEGYASEEECRYLYDFACRTPADGVIVELGTYKGRTAIVLAQSGRDVFAVDRFEAETDGFFHGHPDHHAGRFSGRDVIDAAQRYGVVPFVITGDTARIGNDWPDICGRAVDLLFVDAGHDYESVRADFDAWAPYLSPEAIVIFDDVLWPGVMRFLSSLDDWAPVSGPQAGGMAAFHRIPVAVEAGAWQ